MKTNLKEKFDNGVKFVKDHKKEILIGAGALAATVVTGKMVYNKMEECANVGIVLGMDIGINAVCKQQNLDFEKVCNNELAGIIKDFMVDEKRIKEKVDLIYDEMK